MVRCDIPPSIENSFHVIIDLNMDGDDLFTYGETAVYHCVEGYTRVGGNVSKSCDENGLLSGNDILCEGIYCILKYVH